MATKKCSVTLFGVALCLLIPMVQGVVAQTTSGTIQGTVKDSAGAVVAGAEVTVTQKETGFTRSTTSNEEGNYGVPLLPGTYNIQVTRAGFQNKNIEGVILNGANQVHLDVTLEAQGVAVKVDVTSMVSPVDTTTPSLGQVITNLAVEDLPLNGRNFLQLALLSAGAVPVTINPGSSDTAAFNQSSINVSGGRESSN